MGLNRRRLLRDGRWRMLAQEKVVLQGGKQSVKDSDPWILMAESELGGSRE